MGREQTGKWFVHADELCLDLPMTDGGCFDVASSGAHESCRQRELALEGILQTISEKDSGIDRFIRREMNKIVVQHLIAPN